MLDLHGLQAGYSDKPVLRGASLTVPQGCVTALLGPNGCGKSTLLKALCRLVPLRAGSIQLDGENLLALPQQLLAQKVAYLSQNRRIPDMSVRQLVLHGRFPYLSYPRRYRPQDMAVAEDAMRRMDVLDLADMPLQQLSGGQRQKVYIAMALAQDTPVMLLDEPTTFLDVAHQLQLLRLARTLAEGGKHVLMVIHDLPHALRMADRVALMRQGEIVFQGTPEQAYASGLLEEVFGVRIVRLEAEGQWQYVCMG